MSIDETIEYLKSVKRMRLRIVDLEEKRVSLLESLLPSGTDDSKERVQTSPSDVFSEKVAESVDNGSEADELREQLKERKMMLNLAIDKLEDDEEKIIIRGYYINEKPMWKLARLIPCSKSKAHTIKDEAIVKLSAIL